MPKTLERLSPPLRIEADPFVSNAARPYLGRQLQMAFREIIRQIALQTPIVLVIGEASTGKTSLVDITARTCSDMGLSVGRVDRGDLMHLRLDQRCDVMLVDEANSVGNAILEGLAPGTQRNTATTTVFLGLPTCAARFISNLHPVIVELTPFSASDARDYLCGRAAGAGLPGLFTDEALKLILDGAQGSPRLLLSIASMAFLAAVSDGSHRISLQHAQSALAMQLPLGSPKPDAPDLENPLADATLSQDVQTGEIVSGTEKPAENSDGGSPINETPHENKNIAAPPDVRKLTETLWAHAPSKDESDAMSRSGTQKLAETLWLRDGDISAESSQPRIVHPFMRSMVNSRTLVAGIAIAVVVAAVIAATQPWSLTRMGFHYTALQGAAPVPLQPAGLVAPAPASTEVSNETEKLQETATVQSDAQSAAPAENKTAGHIDEKIPAAKTAQAIRRPLTDEEAAAIARGIREMEKAPAQAGPQSPRR